MEQAIESTLNPTIDAPIRVTDENRVPMGLPELSLAVPEIPGHQLHWFVDRPGRIPQALRAGWQFVVEGEVQLNTDTLAGSPGVSGNTDLGSRVSIHAGTDESGRGMRQYLMKQKDEWYQKDMALREEGSEQIAASLRAGRVGDSEKGSPEDAARRYKGTPNDNLFTRRQRR